MKWVMKNYVILYQCVLKYLSKNYGNPMRLRQCNCMVELHLCILAILLSKWIYAQDSKLAGNQRCWVSKQRKRNGACAMFKAAEILTERFCEVKWDVPRHIMIIYRFYKYLRVTDKTNTREDNHFLWACRFPLRFLLGRIFYK